MNRKGQFTIPNMVGVAFLFLVFAIIGRTAMFPILSETASNSGPMLSALLKSLPAVFLSIILFLPYILAQKRRVNSEEQARNRRMRR